MTSAEFDDVWPLSPMQEGLLFHASYDEEGPDVYIGQHVLRVEGQLDAETFRATWAALLRRHASLRASFRRRKSGSPVQVVVREVVLPWRVADVSGLAGTAALAEAGRLAGQEREQRFDLAVPPLVRLLLIRFGPARHQLVLTHHHILLDGWSLPVMLAEVSAIYAAGGSAAGLAPVTPYRDYLAWLARQDRAAARAAWAAELAGLDQPCLVAGPGRGRAPVAPDRVQVLAGAQLTAAGGGGGPGAGRGV